MFRGDTPASAIFVLALVCALGLGIGRIRIRGIGLGTAGVLFAGIVFGRLGIGIVPEITHFVKEFGLVLFVFTIGMQIGPGFAGSMRRQGIELNLIAATVVALGAAVTACLAWLVGIPASVAVGLFCGATTNTPALGAAQEVLTASGTEAGAAGMGYALGYPLGVLGTIGTLVCLRALFRMNVRREVEAFENAHAAGRDPLERRCVAVRNPGIVGRLVGEIRSFGRGDVVLSRRRTADGMTVDLVRDDTRLAFGDVLVAVGTRNALDGLEQLFGARVEDDLVRAPGTVTTRRLVVTHDAVLGASIATLEGRFGIACTRVTRNGIELVARPDLTVQFADVLQVVGPEAAIAEAAAAVGNATRELDVTRFGTMFLGIVAGVAVGSVPVRLPGLPVPLRLGLAAGPLLAAIVLSALGRVGRLVFYMPAHANVALREFGITLFMAAVGLGAGAHFAAHPLTIESAGWVAAGAAITIAPLLLVGVVARIVRGFDYVRLCGLVAGSMTDPPALAFGNAVLGGDAASTTYAAVYPLTMLLRVIAAQVLALLSMGR